MQDQDAVYKETLGFSDISELVEELIEFEEGKSMFPRYDTATYILTNEDHSAVFKRINHKDKSILGITGSGDYMFSALAQGYDSFTGVDVSIRACLYAELKFAALKNFSRRRFKRFFWLTKDEKQIPKAYSTKDYDVLRPELSNLAKAFFDRVIGKEYLKKDHFTYEHEKMPLAARYLQRWSKPFEGPHIPYLMSWWTYRKAQKNARKGKKHKFVPMDIREYITSTNGKYDLIYLSNLPSWLDRIESKISDDELIHNLKEQLNPGGIIVLYGTGSCEELKEKLELCGFKSTDVKANPLSKLSHDMFTKGHLVYWEAYALSSSLN